MVPLTELGYPRGGADLKEDIHIRVKFEMCIICLSGDVEEATEY